MDKPKTRRVVVERCISEPPSFGDLQYEYSVATEVLIKDRKWYHKLFGIYYKTISEQKVDSL